MAHHVSPPVRRVIAQKISATAPYPAPDRQTPDQPAAAWSIVDVMEPSAVWTLLIVRDAFDGVRRFGAFQKNLGIAKGVLTARLKEMVERGVMTVTPASDGTAYQEYVLTEKGRDLFAVVVALRQWVRRISMRRANRIRRWSRELPGSGSAAWKSGRRTGGRFTGMIPKFARLRRRPPSAPQSGQASPARGARSRRADRR